VCFLQHPPLAQRAAAAAAEELLFCSFSYFPSTWKVLKLTNVMTYFLWLNGKGHKADFFPTRKITAAAPFLWTRSFLYFSLLSLPLLCTHAVSFFTLSPFASVVWSFKLIFLVSSCQRGHTNTYLLLNARSIIRAGKNLWSAQVYKYICMEKARTCT